MIRPHLKRALMRSAPPASRALYSVSQPTHLFLDFDGTLTVQDTLATLAKAGYASNGSTIDLPMWSEFGAAYLDDYRAHAESYPVRPAQRRTVDAEADWLRSLKPVERASAERIDRSGLFDNVSDEVMRQVAREALHAKEVEMRLGWLKLIASVLENGGRVDVLSVNFSRTWIKEVLLAAVHSEKHFADQEAVRRQESLAQVQIWANEIGPFRGRSDQRQQRQELRTSTDKLRVMQLCMEKNNVGEGEWQTVYVGDSITDLECIISAEVGILIRNRDENKLSSGQRETKEVLERINVASTWVDLPESNKAGQETKQNIWFSEDFEQITTFLEKMRSSK